MAEQKIRVSAKGEFSQLQQGLRQLQGNLKQVVTEINKGARKGGFFDENQLRALTIFKRRFTGSLQEMDRELKKHNDVIDQLYQRQGRAGRAERSEIEQTIKTREKDLDIIRKQVMEAEQLYHLREKEVASYGRKLVVPRKSIPNKEQTTEPTDNNRSSGGGFVQSIVKTGKGLSKIALPLAGIAGIAAIANQAYQHAYMREVNSLDLAQRLRGKQGWQGTNTAQFDRASEVGRRDHMGYSAAESWQFLDRYTRIAGAINTDQQHGLMKFGRAYGLESTEVSERVGANRAIGGTHTPKAYADAIAGSLQHTGMTPRIAEVMETNNALLQQMNTTLKDGSSKQILAYQTTLDRIGTEKSMMKLTGAQGGNLISGLGGIFKPGNDNKWKWMGIQALQQYHPKKYGNMDLFNLEMAFEDGLLNADNVPAMATYTKNMTGGNESLTKRLMQSWLMDGGYAATKREASEFYDATKGLTVFGDEPMKKLREGHIDAGAKYDKERKGLKGQAYMDTDARFEHAMEQLGQPIVTSMMTLKEGITQALEQIIKGFEEQTDEIVRDMLTVLGVVEATKMVKKIRERRANKRKSIDDQENPSNKENKNNKDNKEKKDQKKDRGSKQPRAKKNKGKGFLPFVFNSLPGLAAYTALNGSENTYNEAVKWTDYAGDILSQSFHRLVSEEPWKEHTQRIRQAQQEHIHWKKQNPVPMEQLLKTNKPLPIESFPAKHRYIAEKTTPDKYQELHRKILAVEKSPPSIANSVADYTGSLLESGAKVTWDFGKQLLQSGIKTTEEVYSLLFGGKDKGKGDSDIGRNLPEIPRGLLFVDQPKPHEYDKHHRVMSEHMEEMSDSGITDFRKMADSQEELSMRGIGVFRHMHKEVQRRMTDVYLEHRGFKAFISDLFYPFATYASTLRLNGNEGMESGYHALKQSDITASRLDEKLGGRLTGYGHEFISAGERHGIDPALIAAISMHETGNGTSNVLVRHNNVGGMMAGNRPMHFQNISEGIEAMARNLKQNYIHQGKTTIEEIQKTYSPIGATNDPQHLNQHWTSGVYRYLHRLGICATPNADVFSGWRNKINSRFGDVRGRMQPHGGLDIATKQGDTLQALASGTISILHKDPKNKRAGGSELGVRMEDGRTYFYSHMSKVNPNLKVGTRIQRGDWIGNAGGERGQPGSGHSTTGSHLHVGYLDRDGSRMNPEDLLKLLHIGDSSIGKEKKRESPSSVQELKSTIDVTIKVSGEGASVLNHSTKQQMKSLVKQCMVEHERRRLSLAPTKMGYAP